MADEQAGVGLLSLQVAAAGQGLVAATSTAVGCQPPVRFGIVLHDQGRCVGMRPR